ncbi:MAG: hypothetical protein ABIZ34_07765, partial [Candidatus Limnocylindrales bacterium]
ATTSFGEGDQRTLLLYSRDDPFSDGTGLADLTDVLDLWEHPKPESIGSLVNAIPPADPAKAQLFVIGAGVKEGEYGLRLAVPGIDGCAIPLANPGILIGGNQVVAFDITDATEVTVHDVNDDMCDEAPVGGPFAVSTDAGGRAYLVLYGAKGAMESLFVAIP